MGTEQNYCHTARWAGTCEDAHVDCPATFGRAVMQAMQLAKLDAVTKALRERPQEVRYNRTRGSIQIYDCKGVITTNLPLSREMRQTLEGHLVAQSRWWSRLFA